MFPETPAIVNVSGNADSTQDPRRTPAGETDAHPLLPPLAEVQDTVVRLEATAATAFSAFVEGPRARAAYQKAAGWLAHDHT
jgi:hypothetical protein